MKKKIFIIILLFLVLSVAIISFLPDKQSKNSIYFKVFQVIEFVMPEFFHSTIRMIVNNKINSQKIKNDYNTVFLPETQFAKVDLVKIPLNFIKASDVGYKNVFRRKPFQIDTYKNYIFVMPKIGEIYYKDIDDLYNLEGNFKKIQSNIKTENALDIYMDQKHVYISYIKTTNDCEYLYLAKSKINLREMFFEDIFSITDECMTEIQAGRIQKILKDNISYILLSTSADSLKNKDQSDSKPQSNKSLYGKIIAINDNDYSFKIFSKGHRNILGLAVVNDVILATENGPYGGDEINIINENKNYGWDIASYGKKYRNRNEDDDEKGNYADHKILGFEEPAFSFLPSLGISEIIKIDDNFDNDWKENFIIGSLNYKHILRTKINPNLNKIDYYEKIYIGERIRDLKYIKSKSLIFMALENSGSLGILKKVN
tara:strand:- start:47 stop:1333 length:1287 start_codon:yes stop_codon:yes gene_type:complete